MFLTERLRDAYYATDQILAGRPSDEFIVTMRAKDGEFCLFAAAFIRDGKNVLKKTTIRAEAMIFTFTAALDVVEALGEYQVVAKAVPR